MINEFVLKKWGALLMVGMITTVAFYGGVMLKGFLVGIAGLFIGLIISCILGNLLLKNPFSLILEGKGVLFLDINSTGVIRPFVLQVRPPYVQGTGPLGAEVQDVFDRDMVYNLAVPQKGGDIQQGKGTDGETRTQIVLNEEDYNRGRFGFLHYPCVIWNSVIGSIITKDYLSDNEKTSFAEHQLLFMNEKTKELSSAMRDFGRYVVEQLRPKLGISGGTIAIIIIVIIIIVLIALFGPSLLPQIKAAFGGAAQGAAEAAKTAGAVSVRP